MHLTPEQIDRQPFRMKRRGYDIVQVRNFLREIATEMRARQEVREQLAAQGNERDVAEDRAHTIISEAHAKADEIIAEAEAAAGSLDDLRSAERRAQEIVGAADGIATQMIEEAELAARARSDAVLSATQARLDQLLQEERDLHARVQAMHLELDGPDVDHPTHDARDVVRVDNASDSSLADFMKSTLRHEVE